MKLPWMKFWPLDWIGDMHLAKCTYETQGVWMKVLCCLWKSGSGKVSGTIDELSHWSGIRSDTLASALCDLQKNKAADIRPSLQTSLENSVKITVKSRRIDRDLEAKKKKKSRDAKYRNKKEINTNDAQCDAVNDAENDGQRLEARSKKLDLFKAEAPLSWLSAEWSARSRVPLADATGLREVQRLAFEYAAVTDIPPKDAVLKLLDAFGRMAAGWNTGARWAPHLFAKHWDTVQQFAAQGEAPKGGTVGERMTARILEREARERGERQ